MTISGGGFFVFCLYLVKFYLHLANEQGLLGEYL